MKEVYDMLTDESGDILFRNGDIAVGESTEQHIAALLIHSAGEWREQPLLGIGLARYLNGEEVDMVALRTAIERVMRIDGLELRRVQLDAPPYIVEGNYR